MDDMAARRRASQPREASAGCVFRNPEGDKAGRLIDLSGLKGRAVGPVSVSPTHANFLVNAGEAKAADFLTLMRMVRAEVKARQGVELQPEIVALGREWKELL
jgi:UDP-N-acetylenolpyruvoylglucosamine reductase